MNIAQRLAVVICVAFGTAGLSFAQGTDTAETTVNEEGVTSIEVYAAEEFEGTFSIAEIRVNETLLTYGEDFTYNPSEDNTTTYWGVIEMVFGELFLKDGDEVEITYNYSIDNPQPPAIQWSFTGPS